ncbi:MAG TPA: hypothetical protein VNV44_10420 [Solirubrobacteraceae bacterium]|jgi:hypothetical protein|nr:hypothetical protein [Solirubrobacteraceae bacterium]
MPRVIVTTNLPPAGSAHVLLDEHVSSVHLSSDHAAGQLIERLTWAIRDAEQAELDRLARPLLHGHSARPARRRPAVRGHAAARASAAA